MDPAWVPVYQSALNNYDRLLCTDRFESNLDSWLG